MRQALKHESNGTTWQIALLSCLFDGELLFLNTRLSVKVTLSNFNLVKAIQSCRKEVKIWSKNFWAYKCNTRSYCHYAFKPRRKQSKGTQQRHLFNICFANVFIKRSYFLLRHIFTNFVAKSCYGHKVWRCWAVAILNKLL